MNIEKAGFFNIHEAKTPKKPWRKFFRGLSVEI